MAPLNIHRLDGECEADFQRRYCREKMRIYRARKPKLPPKARERSSTPPCHASHTQEEWEAMARRPDESAEDWKRRKVARRVRLWRARNPELTNERSREYYRANPEKERARRQAAQASGAAKEWQRRYFHKNREKRVEALKAWAKANPERYAEIKQLWYDENRHRRNAYSARWRRQARIATPPWADLAAITAIYAEAIRISAETGVEHHVDHYYPLRGRSVSGLHVEANLRIITGTENLRKQNRHPDAG